MVEHHVALLEVSSIPCFCVPAAIDRLFHRPPQPVRAILQINLTAIRDFRQSSLAASHAHLLTHLRDNTKPQQLHEVIFDRAWRFIRLHG